MKYETVEQLIDAEFPAFAPRFREFLIEQGKKDTETLEILELYRDKVYYSIHKKEWGYLLAVHPGWQSLGKDLRSAINTLCKHKAWEHWGKIE